MSNMHTELESLYAAQVADIEAATRAAGANGEHEGVDASDYLNEIGYGYNVEMVVSLVLAGGGPGATVDVTLTKGTYGWEADSAKWVGSWAGAPLIHELTEDSAMFRWAAGQAEMIAESGGLSE
jgi:hypothetical protein